MLSTKWRKPLNRLGKTGSNPLKNLVVKQPQNPHIYRLEKTSRWGIFSALAADGRPARSTANGQNSDRWSLGRPARSTAAWNREQSFLPVDRPGRPGLSREQKLSGGRPGRSTSPPADLACTFCARRSTVPVDRPGRPHNAIVDQPGRPAVSQSSLI